MKKIIIIGAGAMGSAFAVPCIDNNNDVTIIGTHLEDNLIDSINLNNQVHPALKIQLPPEIKFERFEKLQSILKKDIDLIVVGVSSVGIEWFVEQISKSYRENLPIILLTKGLSIFDNELSTLSDKIKKLLKENRKLSPKLDIENIISDILPKRLAQIICKKNKVTGNISELSNKILQQLSDNINAWLINPTGSEGYRTAEVTLGGVNTKELSSKTMMSNKHKNLFFIGEVVDVTGHLGGYNFQWAWSSGYVAGQYA